MNKKLIATLLIGTVLVVLAAVAIPVFLIMPFKSQTPSGVALSFALRRWAPLITALGFGTGLVLIALLWRRSASWGRALALLALLPLGGSAWFARQNHFEWMFAPLEGVSRVGLSGAGFVEPGDMVMGIVSGDVAMAYPVNQVAYHHVVNDTVGGVPIAATY